MMNEMDILLWAITKYGEDAQVKLMLDIQIDVQQFRTEKLFRLQKRLEEKE